MQAFVDSDVIISSLISNRGAANLLLYSSNVELTVSSLSLSEVRKVVKRMKLSEKNLENLVKKRLNIYKDKKSLEMIKREYEEFTTDINDTHIVAGAHLSGSKYFISYNLKHFKIDRIKDEFGIISLTPALFLQYLRSV